MISKKLVRFIYKKMTFCAKNVNEKDINFNYINALSTKRFVRFNKKKKKTSFTKQANYIKEINKSSDRILTGFFHKKALIGTVGAQKISEKKFYIGILLFDKVFKGIGFSKIMLQIMSLILLKNFKVKMVYATVNKNNIISHNLFSGLGFKPHKSHPKRYKSDVVYYIQTSTLKGLLAKNQNLKMKKL